MWKTIPLEKQPEFQSFILFSTVLPRFSTSNWVKPGEVVENLCNECGSSVEMRQRTED